MNRDLLQEAVKNIQDILNLSIKFNPKKNNALVVFDTQNELTDILTAAYRQVLPKAKFIDFDQLDKDQIIAEFHQMIPEDLVVLIQSANFRLDDFRIRINLFIQKLKTIEHAHLYRNHKEVWDVYVNSLQYDPNWYHKTGHALHKKLAEAPSLTIQSGDCELVVEGQLEIPKLNIGDYSGMENVGGTFPIGEVFTEAKNFESMNGSFLVYAFADTNFEISMSEVFRVDIKNGLITGFSDNAPLSFVNVVENIKTIERPLIREIGFGLNRAITKERFLGDITAFERILGIHLSLGEKHTVYKKQGIQAHKARFHVDLFLQVDQVLAGNQVVFKNGEYLV